MEGFFFFPSTDGRTNVLLTIYTVRPRQLKSSKPKVEALKRLLAASSNEADGSKAWTIAELEQRVQGSPAEILKLLKGMNALEVAPGQWRAVEEGRVNPTLDRLLTEVRTRRDLDDSMCICMSPNPNRVHPLPPNTHSSSPRASRSSASRSRAAGSSCRTWSPCSSSTACGPTGR